MRLMSIFGYSWIGGVLVGAAATRANADDCDDLRSRLDAIATANGSGVILSTTTQDSVEILITWDGTELDVLTDAWELADAPICNGEPNLTIQSMWGDRITIRLGDNSDEVLVAATLPYFSQTNPELWSVDTESGAGGTWSRVCECLLLDTFHCTDAQCNSHYACNPGIGSWGTCGWRALWSN